MAPTEETRHSLEQVPGQLNGSDANASLLAQILLDNDDRLRQGVATEERRLIYLISVPIMLFFCTVATSINLSICLSSRLIRRPLSPTMCFSVSLAGADAYAAGILGLGLLFNSLLPVGFGIEPLDVCFSLAFEALRLGGVISTAAHLLALALNHYMGILRPLHYARLITRGRVLICIVFLWVVPILFFFLYFLAAEGFHPDQCSHTFLLYSTFRSVVASLFFVPLVFMVFTYSHIFVIVRQHQHGVLRNQNASQLNKNVKAIVTTLLILGTYVGGWMPGLLNYVLVCADCSYRSSDLDPRAYLALNIFVNTLIILKCLVDPVIYAARMPEIKLALRRLGALLCCRRGSLEELGRTQTMPILSFRYHFSRSTTSSSRLSTLRQNGDALIPLRVLKAARAVAEPVDC